MRRWLFGSRFWLLIVVALPFLRHGRSSMPEFTTDLTTVISTRLPETTTGDDGFTDATTNFPFFVDDILIVAPTGVCFLTVFWRQPVLPDLTFVASSHQPQTSYFGIGKTEVVYLFADMLGNFHCVTFIVEVVPESPILVDDIVKVVPDGVCYARVNWKGPFLPDLWLVSSSHQPVTSLFNLGETQVTYVFANMAGDFFCVTFLVEVRPESPLLVDDIVEVAPLGVNYVTVDWKGPFLPGKTLVSSSHQPNTSPFCIGITKVVYVFVNATTGEFCCVCFFVEIISDAETTESIQTTSSPDVETTTSYYEFQNRGLFNDGEWSCENANPCLGSHVTCMDDLDGPYCVCDTGYQFSDGSQWACADVNECVQGLDDCEPSAHLTCFNEEGGYSCRCLDGFTMTAGGTCQIGTTSFNSNNTNSEFERYVSILLTFRTTAINKQPAVFSTELLNETSDKFKLLASFTCSSVMEVFSGIPPLPVQRCSALGFRSGSIRVFLQLEIALTTLSTESIKETFMSKLYDDSNGFKVLERTNGDSLKIEGSSVKFEYINDISCDDIVCHNGGVCQVDQKIYERGCLCPPNLTGSNCETELTNVNGTLKVTESILTSQRIDSVSVVTQKRRTSAIYIVIPVVFTACVIMFLLMCCCYVSLKHKANRKPALVEQRTPIDVIQLHRMNYNKSHRRPEVIRNPGVRVNESYEESELEDERRLRHFERIFTEMRKSGLHSISSNAPEDGSVSSARLSEFSHPYTADGSVNF
ncbi:Hyalin [Holothuria leucospilota]|uniref:Hyalin n=1 Tax=Holothuria leucospilota TaxID=206669 RepID=A0A9Q1C7A0_HOLLE|nr:Hyalin [Holothuria leucospilota]